MCSSDLISGAAGLVFSVNPDLTEAQVKQLLYTTADKVGKSGYDANGHSVYYGYGRVNANKAVAAAGGVAPGDVKRYQVWYRNPPAGFCGAFTFNLSNGVQVNWSP